MGLIKCLRCGKEFEGNLAKLCPDCRKDSKLAVLMASRKIRKCVTCGKEELMIGCQKRCRECIDKSLTPIKYSDFKCGLVMVEKILEKREAFEKKYFADTRCPNYGLMGTDCLGCPDGAYEFKACGRYKKGEQE